MGCVPELSMRSEIRSLPARSCVLGPLGLCLHTCGLCRLRPLLLPPGVLCPVDSGAPSAAARGLGRYRQSWLWEGGYWALFLGAIFWFPFILPPISRNI